LTNNTILSTIIKRVFLLCPEFCRLKALYSGINDYEKKDDPFTAKFASCACGGILDPTANKTPERYKT
jgi:hypothetical protein